MEWLKNALGTLMIMLCILYVAALAIALLFLPLYFFFGEGLK